MHSPERLHTRLILLFLILGAALRLSHYLSQRSFWHDEAFLIFNLRAKTATQLLGPLNAAAAPQAAPPGFLMVEKAALRWWGGSEWSLRWVAQILALLSLLLLARAAWVLSPGWGAVFAMALFALCDPAIEHSAEVKSYSGDIFFACLLLWMAVGTRGDSLTPRRFFGITIAASLIVWCSYTAVFIFGGISFAYVATMDRRRPGSWGKWVLLQVPLAISLAALYFFCIRRQQDPRLYADWASAMADWKHIGRLPFWFVKSTYLVMDSPAQNTGPIVLLFSVAGAVVLWMAGKLPRLALLLSPILLCLLASLIDAYPYDGSRATLFLIPTICVLAGTGFGALIDRRQGILNVAAWVLGGLVIGVLFVQASYYVWLPRTRTHIRPAIEFVRSHRRPGDIVWIVGGPPSTDYLCYDEHPDPLTILDPAGDRPLPAGRFWLVFATAPGRLDAVMKPVMDRANAAAQCREMFKGRGGAAVLFER